MNQTPAIIDHVAILAKGDFFSSLPTHVLAAVVRASRHVAFDAGHIIMTEGEHGDCMFALLSGSVDIKVRTGTIRHCEPGDVIGDLGLLLPAPRSATATCTAASEFLRIDSAVLDELLLDYPEVGKGIITTLVRRLRQSGDSNP
jgi:CRP-like cAMP-binding protein